MTRGWIAQLIWMITAFLIVAFGQPAWIPWLGLVAAVIGFALFWKPMLQISSRGSRFWVATLWFTLVQLVQLSWMTSDKYQGFYIWCVWVLLAFFMGLQFGLVSLIVRPSSEMSWLRTFAVPAAWVVMEGIRFYIFSGLTFGIVGLELTGWIIPMQMASLFGVYGLSFWVMLTNILVLRALLQPKRVALWLTALGVAAVPYVYGTVHYLYHAHQIEKSEERPLTVLLVQTSLRPGERIPLGTDDIWIPPYYQWLRILSFIAPYEGQKLDLIVLPEAVVPYGTYQPYYSLDDVSSAFDCVFCHEMKGSHPPSQWPLVREVVTSEGAILATNNAFFTQVIANCFDCDVVAGFEVTDEAPGEEPVSYAAAFLFKPGQLLQKRYEKRILLPVAEEIPFEWAKPLAAMYGIKGSFKRGQGAQLFDGPVPMGISICYEETFSYIVREAKTLGAQLFVNVSNDGWYPNSRLPGQHFAHGRLRSVENGVPAVRACNTGMTVALDSLGRTIALLGADSPDFQNVAGAIKVRVPTYHYATLYSKFGDGVIFGFSLATLLLFLTGQLLYEWRLRSTRSRRVLS
jgi:apolipoprotein N-acyltransferase